MEELVECIVDGCFGVYVGQRFAQKFAGLWQGVEAEEWDILLAGPDHELYDEVWDDVYFKASFVDPQGREWRLFQEGDLFAYCGDGEAFV